MAFAMTQARSRTKTLFRPRGVSGYNVGRNGYSMSRSLGAIDIYKKNRGLGASVSTSSKTLSIPAKRWGSVSAFLKDFPETKLSLFLSLYPSKNFHTMKSLPKVPIWEQNKRLAVHENIVRYAISKQLPITKTAYINSSYNNVVIAIERMEELREQWQKTTWQFFSPSFGGGSMPTNASVILYPGSPMSIKSAYNKSSIPGYSEASKIIGADTRYLYLPWLEFDPFYLVYIKFMAPEVWEAMGKIIDKYAISRNIRHIDVNWEKLIDAWLTSPAMVANFEAYSSEEQIQFQEVYGVTDPTQMAPYTISYIVTKDAPPTPDDRWNGVQFWSELFKKREGFAILQAVAEQYPVKVKTRAMAFKEDPSFYTKTIVNDWAKEVWQYVFNDFDIEITPDAKILIRYNRDTKTETLEYSTKKKKTWSDYVGYAILAVGLTVATVGVGTAILGAMAAASAASGAGAVVPVVSGGYAAGQGAALSTAVLTSGGYAAGTGAATAAAAGVTVGQVTTAASIAASVASALPKTSSVVTPMASIGPGATIPVAQAAVPASTGLVSQLATTGSQLYAAGEAVTPVVTTAAKVASTGMQISSAYDAITANKAGIETPQPFVFDTVPQQQQQGFAQAGMLGMPQLDAKSLLLLSAFGTIAFMLFKGR